jgi:hypothetical protein
MSGTVNKTAAARYKLIKTFFWISHQIGEENARAVMERMYNKTSIKLLTTDELKCVIDELVKCTQIDLRKPAPKRATRAKDIVVTKGGRIIELPTREQLAIIEYHADKMGMSQETLQSMIKRVSGHDTGLTLLSARTLIEALKGMHSRGWKDKTATDASVTAFNSMDN